MAVASDCGPCAWGNHTHHDRDHGTIPGLLGGTYCACTGDCATRAAERTHAMTDWFLTLDLGLGLDLDAVANDATGSVRA